MREDSAGTNLSHTSDSIVVPCIFERSAIRLLLIAFLQALIVRESGDLRNGPSDVSWSSVGGMKARVLS